ncbi:retrotransposon protein, putative, ty3-gypsy subclass [Tanacetum coccineum]
MCRAAGTCFKCGQAGHLQRDCKKNTGASSSGHADKKPDASGRVFALTQDQAPAINSAVPISKAPYAFLTPIEFKRVEGFSYRVVGCGGFYSPACIAMGSQSFRAQNIFQVDLQAGYNSLTCEKGIPDLTVIVASKKGLGCCICSMGKCLPMPHGQLKPLSSSRVKANVVADALSRKSGMIAGIKVEEEIICDLERLDIELCVRGQNGFWASLRVEPNLISQIKAAQKDDGEIWAIIQNIDKQTEFRVDDDGILWQGTKLCVPEDPTLREALMTEAHSSPFSIHPGVWYQGQLLNPRFIGPLRFLIALVRFPIVWRYPSAISCSQCVSVSFTQRLQVSSSSRGLLSFRSDREDLSYSDRACVIVFDRQAHCVDERNKMIPFVKISFGGFIRSGMPLGRRPR